VVLFQGVENMSAAQKVEVYLQIYIMALLIPVVSVSGVLLASGLRRHEARRLALQGFSRAQIHTMQHGDGQRPPVNWWILGGGLAFVVFTLSLGLTQVPFDQEIIFTGSLAIVVFLMWRLVRELEPSARHTLVGTALLIFVFRALPGPGAGVTWWTIDVLGFDQQFISKLTLISTTLTLFGMFFFRRFMAEHSMAYIIGFLTVVLTLLTLQSLGMFYGLHHWTAAHTDGIVDARFIAQRFSPRQDAGLDPLCRLQLAGNVRGLHTLRLHHVFERFPAPGGVTQRQHQQHAEENQQAHAVRCRVVELPLRSESQVRTQQGKQDQGRRKQGRVRRLPARRDPDEQEPEHDEHHQLDRRGPRGALQPGSVEYILQQLRVNLAAGHGNAQGCVLVVGGPEPGHADEDEFVAQRLRVDFAFEHVDRGNVALFVPFRVVDSQGAIFFCGQVHVSDGYALHGGSIHMQSKHWLLERNTQHLDREGWRQCVVDVGDKRDAPEDSLRGIGDRQQAVNANTQAAFSNYRIRFIKPDVAVADALLTVRNVNGPDGTIIPVIPINFFFVALRHGDQWLIQDGRAHFAAAPPSNMTKSSASQN
jgi:hypothetical protein